MTLSVRCLKYLVLVYNVLFCITGFTVFVLNSYFLYQILRNYHFTGSFIAGPTITLLIIGLVTCCLSWIGWRSAWYLHRIHVIMFGILLLILVVVELGCSIWSVVIWDTMKDNVTQTIENEFSAAIIGKEEDSIKRWEKIQNDYLCCGIGGPADYRNSKSVPWSCCRGSQLHSFSQSGDCGEIYQRGCLTPLYDMGRKQVMYTGVTGLCAALLQSTGLFCVFYLAAGLRRPSEEPRRGHPPGPRQSVAASESLLPRVAPPPPPKY